MLSRTASIRSLGNVARRALSSTPPGKADLSLPNRTNPGADLPSPSRQLVNSRDEEIRAQHEQIPSSVETRKKRLIWRSKQRGLLEVDILLGTWAMKHVPNMTNQADLDQYESLLNLETIDLFNVISKPQLDMSTVPEKVKTGPVLDQIRQFARGFNSQHPAQGGGKLKNIS